MAKSDLARLKDAISDAETMFPDRSGEQRFNIIENAFIRGLSEDFGTHGVAARERFKRALHDNPRLYRKTISSPIDPFTESVKKIQAENPKLSKQEALVRAFAENPALGEQSIKGQAVKGKRIEAGETIPEAIPVEPPSEQEVLMEKATQLLVDYCASHPDKNGRPLPTAKGIAELARRYPWFRNLRPVMSK